jgi:hypothetical protein
MIQVPIPVSNELKNDVKEFCLLNNIEWGTVYSESWVEGVHGTIEQIELVEEFIKNLEKNESKNIKK